MQTLDECAVARVASHDFELITLGRFETKKALHRRAERNSMGVQSNSNPVILVCVCVVRERY